jgi:hypothetical protein
MDGDLENVLCGRDFLESKQNGGPRKNAQEKYIIDIRCIGDGDPLEFEVVIRQQDSETTHRVRMTREMYRRLTAGKHTPEHFLDAAFRFLLDREPKEAILGRFDVAIIGRYFPEFERELPHYLSKY